MSDIQTVEKHLRIRPWVISGLMVVLLVVVGGGFWATSARISGAVIAPGTIGVESKIKTVEHLEGGIVEEIFVTNGDEVAAGDELIRLDDTALRANLNTVSNSLFELLARQARLETELRGSEEIVFPDIVTAQAQNASRQQILADKSNLFEARAEARAGQKQIMALQIVHLMAQIEGLQTQVLSLEEQASILAGNIERKEAATESGVVSQDSLELLRRQQMQVTGDIGAQQSEVARIRSMITQSELQILQVDIDLRERAQTELREVSNRVAELREQAIAFEDRLRRTTILAPVSGLVHNMSVFTIGGIVAPATPIVQIIPVDDRLIVEARISTSDIDQISIGQAASVLLVAFDTRTTPRLEAIVTSVSAAQLTDPATNVPYFTLEVEIPKSQLSRLSDEQKLIPGMPAETYIQTGERSPMDYLLKPLLVQFSRAFKET